MTTFMVCHIFLLALMGIQPTADIFLNCKCVKLIPCFFVLFLHGYFS